MANKIFREILHAKGIDIGIYTKDFENEYISLTDIAKYRNDNDPRFVIQNWMRNRNTVEFLAVWEELHNPDFNRVQFEAVRSEAGLNRFVMTPTKWIEQTNAIGIVSKAGRYGGGTNAKAKANAAIGIPELIEIAIGKHFRKNQEDKHKRDAKYGWYRYDSQFALPVYNDKCELERYNIFHASLLVRHSNDGKLYLYDIIDIKKKRATLSANNRLPDKKPISFSK